MRDPTFWKTHYVVESDSEQIARQMTLRSFSSAGERFDFLSFVNEADSPNVLISPGSGGHS